MTTVIKEKIIGAEVVKPAPTLLAYDRPAKLSGTTYKIKPPTLEAALYITINDIELPGGKRRPFEIFLNSKDITHTQWMVALTRLLSGHFRQPLDFLWALDELKQVYDPKGAYFLPGTHYMCGGIVSHIAHVIEEHCRGLGLLPPADPLAATPAPASEIPTMRQCAKCHQYTLRLVDGCWTCTSCGDSKCG
jgi:ribonucleoside-diphosphate reductase alpha chain